MIGSSRYSPYHALSKPYVVWFGLILVASLFAGLIYFSRHGFDITDEAYYVLFAKWPEAPIRISDFGYLTGFLFQFVGFDIALFRIAGAVLLLVSAIVLADASRIALAAYNGFECEHDRRWEYRIISALGALIYYKIFLLTPSYNWLNLIAVIIVAIGLLLISSAQSPASNALASVKVYFSGALVGIGGGVAFVTKATTAAILAVIVLLQVTHPKYQATRLTFLAVSGFIATAVLLAHALSVDGGVIHYIDRLQKSYEIGSLLNSGHSLPILVRRAVSDLLSLPLETARKFPITALIIIISFVIAFAEPRISRWNRMLPIRVLELFSPIAQYQFLLISSIAMLETVGVQKLLNTQFWLNSQLLISWYLICLIVLLGMVALNMFRTDISQRGLPAMELLALMFVLPLAYGFGSGNGLLRMSGDAAVFLGLGAYLAARVAASHFNQRWAEEGVLISIAIFSLVSLVGAYNKPYRMVGSITNHTETVCFSAFGGCLLVEAETATYVKELQHAARANGWREGGFLIDLTGASPGVSVILSGAVLGSPWLLGGYKGSEAFAEAVLSTASRDQLAHAWVLTAPNGKRQLPTNILVRLGLDFPGGYTPVATVTEAFRRERQILWRPNRP